MFDLQVCDINEFASQYQGEPFDAVLTDAPYELGFMGKDWDKAGVSFNHLTWLGIRNLLRPGSLLLSFGGNRTYHRIAVAIEDGGFQIRDCVGYAWVHGNGFPKNHNFPARIGDNAWDGYGTALKPAWEPIVLAMNPLDGTFANNAMAHGIAGLNIEMGRVGSEGGDGRWPANLIHDGSQETEACFPDAPGQQGVVKGTEPTKNGFSGSVKYSGMINRIASAEPRGDTGSAARFFYAAKPHKKERDAGLPNGTKNDHPTVKPIELTKYLATMVLPPNTGRTRRLLVPFCGSGSEMIGALLAGWDEVVGIDLSKSYCGIAKLRLGWWIKMAGQLHTNNVETILNYAFPSTTKKMEGENLFGLQIGRASCRERV